MTEVVCESLILSHEKTELKFTTWKCKHHTYFLLSDRLVRNALRYHTKKLSDETHNAIIILNFYRLLESHDSTREFDMETVDLAINKLQDYNIKELQLWKPANGVSFINTLEYIVTRNYEDQLLAPALNENHTKPVS